MFSHKVIHLLALRNGGAGEGNRTLVSALGRPYSTIEPHPRPTGKPVTKASRPRNCSFARKPFFNARICESPPATARRELWTAESMPVDAARARLPHRTTREFFPVS